MIDENENNNSNFQIPNYAPIQEMRTCSLKGGRVILFIDNSFKCTVRLDLSKVKRLFKIYV